MIIAMILIITKMMMIIMIMMIVMIIILTTKMMMIIIMMMISLTITIIIPKIGLNAYIRIYNFSDLFLTKKTFAINFFQKQVFFTK